MDDEENFFKILKSKQPGDAKKLGRRNTNWDEDLWQRSVVPIACEICYQKFSKVYLFDKDLLGTGENIMAESTRGDKNWGTGCGMKDFPQCDQPACWPGSNVLGFALMKARERIRIDK